MSFTLKYHLANPVFLLEQGKRPYLEDAIYPPANEASQESRIFMVCDGVGGSTRGDEASRLTCTFFPSLILDNLEQLTAPDYSYTQHYELLSKRLIKLEDEMDDHVHQHPEFRGMATTLTYLHLSPYGVVVAWAGDSRIYQISKNGERKFRTEDHSLVNELVKRGEISEEEAAHHPRKNVILRAVSGAGNPTKLDLQIRVELEDGDYFLACTDGIIDGIEEAELCKVVADPALSLDQKRDFIREKCLIHSRDNFAMYLIQIERVEKTPITELAQHSGTTATGSTVIHSSSTQLFDDAVPSAEAPLPPIPKPAIPNKSNIQWVWLIIIAGLLGGLLSLFLIYKPDLLNRSKPKKDKTINSTSKDSSILPKTDSAIFKRLLNITKGKEAQIEKTTIRQLVINGGEYLVLSGSDTIIKYPSSSNPTNINNKFVVFSLSSNKFIIRLTTNPSHSVEVTKEPNPVEGKVDAFKSGELQYIIKDGKINLDQPSKK